MCAGMCGSASVLSVLHSVGSTARSTSFSCHGSESMFRLKCLSCLAWWTRSINFDCLLPGPNLHWLWLKTRSLLCHVLEFNLGFTILLNLSTTQPWEVKKLLWPAMSTLNLEADLVREYLNVCGIDLKLEQCCRLLGDQKLLLCLHFRSVCCLPVLHKDAQEILYYCPYHVRR